MSTATLPPLLQVRGISKSFPGVRALRGVDLTVGQGEVVALVGENGAGKSTLMKILAGVQQPDSGTIQVSGRAVVLEGVASALREGIALIHQELNLADNLSVGANIFLGREPRRWGWIDRHQLDRDARVVLRRVGLDVAPQTPLALLTIGHQQLVEIAKALSVQARLLIMDEPTSSLSAHETEQLFRVVKELRAAGVSVIYISHRLGEVRELADRVVVLRDGENAGELPRDKMNHANMVRLMVGRELSQFYARRQHAVGAPRLEVERFVTPAWPQHAVSFNVRGGEIVGLAGLVGAGRTELLRTLFGIDQRLAGTIRVAGRPLVCRSPRDAIRAGLALVPEDRKQHGLVIEMSVQANVGLAGLDRHQLPFGFLNRRAEVQDTATMTTKLGIKTPGPLQLVKFLSGGNQQKVVLGKWLALQPQVLLLDEPTRGIDVGAKHEIYRLMEELAGAGLAVLFASSEMEEILGMSDRVIVMHEGRITGELARAQLSEEAIMHLATGVNAPSSTGMTNDVVLEEKE